MLTATRRATIGLGSYLPSCVVTNDDLAACMETTDAWVRTRTGIERRHYAAADQATSDLAVQAAGRALADADMDASEIGCVVIATVTPDRPVPATAPVVAAAVGCKNAAAFDLGAGCSGFVYGLAVASSLVSAMQAPVLLVGADTLTRVTDFGDRTTAVLFGDGAGAVVLTPESVDALGPFDLHSDGKLDDLLMIRAGGSRLPATATSLTAADHCIAMDGRAVYRHAVTRMTECAQTVLERARLTVAEVDLVVAHQANLRIIEAVAARLNIDERQLVQTVNSHGNTSAASIPLALDDCRRHGRLRPGMRVLLTAFGAGLTWGAGLLTWPEEEAR